MTDSLSFDVIARVNSPYKEKFAIPRQPGLVSAAKGNIELLDGFSDQNSVRALNQFSHIWIIFAFHQTMQQGWKPLVRPPRLGGNEKVGVFASRSTFRPNPIGMSVVKLDGVDFSNKTTRLNISGLDLLDQTPVLDIKPYIHYSDAIENATSGFASASPDTNNTVIFSDKALNVLNQLKNTYPELQLFINQVLVQDPRPAYKQNKEDNKVYGMQLYNFNIQWQLLDKCQFLVTNIEQLVD